MRLDKQSYPFPGERVVSDFHVIAGTGSRTLATASRGVLNPLLDQLEKFLVGRRKEVEKDLLVMSGGAEGWDYRISVVAHRAGIPFTLCLPNRGFGDYYYRRTSQTGEDKMKAFEHMLNSAIAVEYVVEDVYGGTGIYIDGKHSNYVRNERMTELADEFVVYNPRKAGGTQHNLDLIIKAELPYTEFPTS